MPGKQVGRCVRASPKRHKSFTGQVWVPVGTGEVHVTPEVRHAHVGSEGQGWAAAVGISSPGEARPAAAGSAGTAPARADD